MWMGGTPPLGYRPDGRSLAIVPEHAELVRDMFQPLSRARQCPASLLTNWNAKERRTAPDQQPASIGGGPFSRGQIYAMLSNPIYIGKINHKGRVHAGQHEAIVGANCGKQCKPAWQATPGANSAWRHRSSLLAGRVFDETGRAAGCIHASKHIPANAEGGKTRYRYYVSRSLQMGQTRMPAAFAYQPGNSKISLPSRSRHCSTSLLS